jgi:hypothetical protein
MPHDLWRRAQQPAAEPTVRQRITRQDLEPIEPLLGEQALTRTVKRTREPALERDGESLLPAARQRGSEAPFV